MNDSKIGTKEAIALILTISIVHSILSMPRNLLSNVRSSILLNLVFVSLILIGIAFIIVKLFKNFPGSDILDISEYLGGKTFKKFLGLFFIAYFIVSSSILLREFCEALEIVYYPMTDVFFVILLFIICVAITSKLEFTATLKTNLIIIPFVLFSIIFLFASNLKNFSYNRVFPILGNGFIDTFIIGIGNIYSFSGIALIYFLPPLLKKPENLKKISIVSVIIFAIYIILTVSIILFMFSFFMSEDEILPLYAAARYIEIGTFFVRLESIFLLIWMLAFACYLSIIVRFSMLIFKKITNIKDPKILAYPLSILMLAIALLPKTYADVKSYEGDIYQYLSLGFNYLFCILLLIFANLKRRKERKA